MKFTLSWLKDHLETSAAIDQLEAKLSAIGLEVEEIVDPADKLGVFTIARVVDAKQHPGADRLRVCQVEISPGAPPVEVVCGAPNARAGMVGVFAPLGSYIPGTDITLEARPVRGVVSNGMLVSERELELSDDHEGIIDLDPALADRVGERYIDVVGVNDPVIDVSITPNRPDCTGVRGIARDLAAAGLGTLKPEPEIGAVDGDDACPVPITLEFTSDTADACPIFAGRHVRGVKNGPSPAWLQKRLTAVGLRPISALVDITNYVSLDRGRPLHVYDADRLSGTIRARLGRDGERFEALDGKTYDVDGSMCVIADDAQVLGLGGIMGGTATGCTDETTNVLIECAYFDPIRTATTGRKAQINSDARYRFERGVDPAFVEPGLDLATRLVMDLCGGTPSKSQIAGTAPDGTRQIAFDVARVARLTGVDVPAKTAKTLMEAVGCSVSGRAPKFKVTTPSWRPDIEGPADLVEEVIRLVGLETVPSVAMERTRGVALPVLTDTQKRERVARRLLAGRGLVEVVTWSFIPKDQSQLFGGGRDVLDLANPISVDLSSMRPSLLPGLLTAAHRNGNRGFQDLAIFEVGQAYAGDQPDEQKLLATGVRVGSAKLDGSGRHWSGHSEPVDAYDAKADAINLLGALGIDAGTVQITTDAPSWFHPGRSAVIRRGPKLVLATFGELHPSILEQMDVASPAVAFEVDLTALPPVRRKTRTRPALAASDLLPLTRDFAFLVDSSVAAGQLLNAARGADKALITNVEVFDVFEGGNLEPGKRSIALAVTIQPQEKTLTDAEIDALASKIVKAVQKATGGVIRG
ncbi:MAG: phenylalanine--tRNA ligase subunit beta [Pseudomonadota bacterium]